MAKKRTIRNTNDSEKVNALSEAAQVFWHRLLMEIDDFGNFHTNPQMLKSKLYPTLSEKQIPVSKILSCLNECLKVELLTTYVIDGKEYLHVFNFGQKLRWGNKSLVPNFNISSRQRPAQIEDEVEIETKVETEEQIVLPFDSENFKSAWKLWLDYKKETFNFRYKTVKSHQAAAEKLGNMASGDEKYAIHLIKNSIERQWQGFFHDKSYGNQQHTSKSGSQQQGFHPGAIRNI